MQHDDLLVYAVFDDSISLREKESKLLWPNMKSSIPITVMEKLVMRFNQSVQLWYNDFESNGRHYLDGKYFPHAHSGHKKKPEKMASISSKGFGFISM